MQDHRVPGLAFAAVDHGKEVERGVYGTANLETGTPVTLESVFELASVSKPITATAVMLLAQDGKLALTDPIIKYIDDAPEAWRAITIRQLLSHTAGLIEEPIVSSDGVPLMDVTTKAQFELIASKPLLFQPGTRIEYSDAGYFLLGMIIERVSGQSYRQFMQSRIFDPLGMTHTSILDQTRILPLRVAPYSIGKGGELQRGRRDWQHELPSAFGVWSTIGDLEKFMNALSSDALLRKSWREQMWIPTKLVDGKTALLRDRLPYGPGWLVLDVSGHRAVAHDGYTGTFLLYFPDIQYSVIVLSNLDAGSGNVTAFLAFELARALRPDIVAAGFKP
jgi:CubicO group peptidase (beta-lactamase class C family)